MNNPTSDSTQKDDTCSGQPLPPPWLRASAADLVGLDFEAPIADSKSADAHELSDLFRAAVGPIGEDGVHPDTPAARVFSMLSAATGMLFKPREPNEPFGAMAAFADGRRTAIPSDFRHGPIDILADMAGRATHPVLQARLADISWLLDRKRGLLAAKATAAYVNIVRKVDSGELVFRFDEEGKGALKHDACDLLRRALQIGRTIGRDKPEAVAARATLIDLRKRAMQQMLAIPASWFCELDLDFGVTDPATLGPEVEAMIAALPADTDWHTIVHLWHLATRAYHFAKKDDDKYRAQTAAAEHLAAMAEKQPSAMIASSLLADAIAELHGVPGQKDRRKQLRHRLVDVQAGISEEMSGFSHPLDLADISQQIEEAMSHYGLRDNLFAFAALDRSPDPARLAETAAKSIREHPLSSLFGASHHDREGKVVHRTEGASFGDGDDEHALQRTIAQHESIRRQVTVSGLIDVARQVIASEHYVSDDVFAWLLFQSPFVPNDMIRTFSRGFLRFFQGDFTSALYILTPLLENSLRHVLKAHGHDVTIFDDATQTQEDRTISSLFEQMRGELDAMFGAAITTDIANVFLNKPGPYLRHALAHGLLSDGNPYGADAIYGCWLIFHLCLLPLFPYREQLQLPFE